jgi:hypothetical protein
MVGRKVTDADEARALLDEQQRSGLPPAGFARSRGIDGRSLNAWRMNLARGASPPSKALQLIELVATTSQQEHPVLTVRCGPFSVDVPSRFDQDDLARLLDVLAAC